MIEFKVPGEPKGKGRPRFSRVGKFTKTYTDAKTKMYEEKIASAARLQMFPHEPLETPVAVFLMIHVGVPASYSKKRRTACLTREEWPTKKPDIDNVAKAFLDAMNGIVYKDDTQVISLHVNKTYSIDPHVHITVSEVLL